MTATVDDLLRLSGDVAAEIIDGELVENPVHRTLTVMRWTADGYLNAVTAGEEDVVRAEPFDAIDLRVAVLFGGDPDDA